MRQILKTTLLLAVTFFSISVSAQAPIKKPEKRQQTTTTTTTTQQKPRTDKSAGANTSTQSSSSTKVSEPMGYINGHGYVDLGLSVKWATCNVGASSPSDYGNYYAWGEISTKSEYTEANSKTSGKSIGDIAGNPQYDAARANWGSTWRMPTIEEMYELVDKCTCTWITQGGHNGYKVMGPSGYSIFLPAASQLNGTSLFDAWECGRYWWSTPYKDYTGDAYGLYFDSAYFGGGWNDRSRGQSVRPVSE